MRRPGRAAPLLLLLAAACARPAPEGLTAFELALWEGYDALAEAEFDEADILDGRRFRRAQRATGAGDPPPPDDLSGRDLDAGLRAELSTARARLVAAQDEIARLVAPGVAARAQIAFDCWAQEAEEGLGQPEIETCREAFLAETAALEEAGGELVVLLPGEGPAALEVAAEEGGGEILLDAPLEAAVTAPQGVAETAPLDAEGVAETLAAAAAVEPEPFESFLVYFDTGGLEIVEESREAFAAALAEARRRGAAARVTVFGHTDTVGSQSVNARVSRGRAGAIADLLIASGLPAGSVEADSFGETRLLVETADGVDEPSNRRVEIVVR